MDLAVRAARKAFHAGPWPSMSHTERGKWMLKLAEAVERNAERDRPDMSVFQDEIFGPREGGREGIEAYTEIKTVSIGLG